MDKLDLLRQILDQKNKFKEPNSYEENENEMSQKEFDAPVTIANEDDSVMIRCLVSGVQKSGISVELENDLIFVSIATGTFCGAYKKTIRLTQNCDVSKIETRVDDGTLFIKIPLKQRKKVKINI